VPWPANGDYYSFKEEAIKLHTPPVSGVYGLYNVKHHVLIGQSNNLRETLLHHRRNTKFRFSRLQPTGFTFEACPAEFREFRVRQLTWEYQPVIHSEDAIGFAAWWRSLRTTEARAFHAKAGNLGQAATWAAKPVRKQTPDKNPTEDGRVNRERFAVASTGFAFVIVAIALFALLAENKIVSENWTRQFLSLANRFTAFAQQSAPVTSLAQAPRATVEVPPPAAKPEPEQQLAGASQVPMQSAVPEPMPAPQSLAIEDQPPAEPAARVSPPAAVQKQQKADARLMWTVQALATTDRADANAWLDRLKAKGYDAFIVGVDIKGQNWYRVRVGSLSSRQEAEALGKTLQTKEGFRDAFVAQSSKSEVILAANSR
jgi:DedD protein